MIKLQHTYEQVPIYECQTVQQPCKFKEDNSDIGGINTKITVKVLNSSKSTLLIRTLIKIELNN